MVYDLLGNLPNDFFLVENKLLAGSRRLCRLREAGRRLLMEEKAASMD
jgi:hypothetical protein